MTADLKAQFTVVFDGDLRKIAGNPFRMDTPFGRPFSCGHGNAFEREEEALARIEALEAERDAALKECSEWARQAGEAQGRLEMSEAAGIVEGWRERAERAEGLLREMFEEWPVQVALAGNPLAIDRMEGRIRDTLRAIRGGE